MLLGAVVASRAIAGASLGFLSERERSTARFADEGGTPNIPTTYNPYPPGVSSVRFGIGDGKGSPRSSSIFTRCQRLARDTAADSEDNLHP